MTSAAGDFSRTSDGWANQVRILQLQFDSLKATIGQGLINVLSPVIKVINTIIGKLMSLANAFKAFTEFITGNKGSGGGASTVAADMGAVADSAGDAASGMNKAAGAAKKAKQAFGLAKFDELNVVSSNDSSGGGSGSGGSGGGGYESDQFDMGTLPEDGDAVSSKLKDIVALVDQLKNSFSKGFWDSFGDTTVFDSIQTSIQSIKDSLNDIFTDSGVQAAATEFANTFMYSLGQVAGAVASIGTTIADNLLGGISLYLDQNKARIKEYLIQMFNIGSEISTLIGNFSSAIADIFSVFRSDSAKQITADIIGIFSSSFQGVTELGGKFARDIIQLITKPITDNSDQIKERIQGLLDELAPVFDKIKKLVDGLWDGLNTAYDTVAKPVFDAFTEALSGVVDWLTKSQENFDIAVGSVVAFFAAWEVVKLGEFITNAGGVVAILSGLVTGFVSNTASIVAHTAALLADKLETAAIVALYAKDFVVNLATGTAALVKQAAQFAINTAAKIADTAAQVAMTAATVAWNAVCAIATTVTTALGAAIAFLTSPIGLVVVAITALIAAGVLLYKNWDEVKAYAATIWGAIKDTVSKLIEAVQEKISAVMQAIRTGIETALNAVKEKWDTIWGGLKDTTVKIFEGIWNGIKGVINKILGGVESMANGVIKGINKLTSALSNIKFDVPDWVPGIGGNSFGIDIPSISEVSLPRLAQGGFVKANTPRLAMIGDNRNYGEIVAPEDKMMEWLNKAVELGARMMGGGGGLSEDDVYYAFKRALNEADLTATLDTDRLFKAMKAKAAEYRRRTGKPAFE